MVSFKCLSSYRPEQHCAPFAEFPLTFLHSISLQYFFLRLKMMYPFLLRFYNFSNDDNSRIKMNGTKHEAEYDSPKKVNCEETQQQDSSDEDEPCTRYLNLNFEKYAVFFKIINITNFQSSVRTQMQLQVGIKVWVTHSTGFIHLLWNYSKIKYFRTKIHVVEATPNLGQMKQKVWSKWNHLKYNSMFFSKFLYSVTNSGRWVADRKSEYDKPGTLTLLGRDYEISGGFVYSLELAF